MRKHRVDSQGRNPKPKPRRKAAYWVLLCLSYITQQPAQGRHQCSGLGPSWSIIIKRMTTDLPIWWMWSSMELPLPGTDQASVVLTNTNQHVFYPSFMTGFHILSAPRFALSSCSDSLTSSIQLELIQHIEHRSLRQKEGRWRPAWVYLAAKIQGQSISELVSFCLSSSSNLPHPSDLLPKSPRCLWHPCYRSPAGNPLVTVNSVWFLPLKHSYNELFNLNLIFSLVINGKKVNHIYSPAHTHPISREISGVLQHSFFKYQSKNRTLRLKQDLNCPTLRTRVAHK